jgi:hypothetical protein
MLGGSLHATFESAGVSACLGMHDLAQFMLEQIEIPPSR